MDETRHKVTTIWFRSVEEWQRYVKAQELLKEDRHTVSTWFHEQVRKLINEKNRSKPTLK